LMTGWDMSLWILTQGSFGEVLLSWRSSYQQHGVVVVEKHACIWISGWKNGFLKGFHVRMLRCMDSCKDDWVHMLSSLVLGTKRVVSRWMMKMRQLACVVRLHVVCEIS
ncbi:hypothetical protein L249_7794, partial [Ophiocordyceps polyrhachis-furcata BCC 54312]